MDTAMELNGGFEGTVLPGLGTPATELSSKYDNLFRTIISAGWAVSSDGNVEAPCGYFARVEVPTHPGERANFYDMLHEWPDLAKQFDEVEPGWYLIVENDQGLIWVYWSNEPQVTDAYYKLMKEYDQWGEL